MAVTLMDLAKQSKTPLQAFIIQNLLRDPSGIMPLIPFQKVDVLSTLVTRWKVLPSVSYRAVNGAYSESSGATDQVTEGLYALGGDILFDRVFDMVGNTIQDIRKTQTLMKIKAIQMEFINALVNGDHATNINMPEGLWKRINSYLPSRQNLSIGSAFDATSSNGNTLKLIYYMHQLIDLAGLRQVPYLEQNGKPTALRPGVILCNRDFRLAFEKALRNVSQLIDLTQDNYGRFWQTFAGVPLIDVGLKPDQSTEIIANNYGGGTNETRVYCVRFSQDDGADGGFTGLNLNSPDLYDPVAAGEVGASVTQGTPAKSLRADWWIGFAGYGSYYAAALTGVKSPTSWT